MDRYKQAVVGIIEKESYEIARKNTPESVRFKNASVFLDDKCDAGIKFFCIISGNERNAVHNTIVRGWVSPRGRLEKFSCDYLGEDINANGTEE